MDKEKTVKVIHLEIKGEHYYYGSVTALFEHWSADQLGVNYRKLRDMRISSAGGYSNDKCIIRVGRLIVSTARNKSGKESEE
jgi:hypothetical protein